MSTRVPPPTASQVHCRHGPPTLGAVVVVAGAAEGEEAAAYRVCDPNRFGLKKLVHVHDARWPGLTAPSLSSSMSKSNVRAHRSSA